MQSETTVIEAQPKQTAKATPKPMQPRIVRESVSTPETIDIAGLVEKTAKRKAECGETFSGTKGKQPLFAAVCAAWKSLRGMEKTAKVDEATEKAIRVAIEVFWRKQADRVLSYGRVVSATYDKPKSLFDDEGTCTGLALNASLRAERDPKDAAEERLFQSFCLKTARKRLDHMLDHPEKFDREEVQAQMRKITAIEARIVAITPQPQS